MVDFAEAVKRPLRADPVTIALGVLFALIYPLRPLLHGFGVETARRTQRGHEKMPQFDDFIDMYLSGLIVLVILILYFVPAALLLVAGALASIPLLMSTATGMVYANGFLIMQLLPAVAGGAFGAVALFFGLLACITAPIGIQLYAHNKRIGSAFEFGKIFQVISRGEYWVTWLLLVAYGVVLIGAVGILTTPINLLTILLGGVASYLWLMTAYTLFAENVQNSGVLSAKYAPKRKTVSAVKRKLKKTARKKKK
jgi:hypothetical protein